MIVDIIDDERHVREMLAEIADILGYQARTYQSGDEYFAYVTSPQYQPPGVVISDVRMPGIDGYNLMRKVNRLYPDVPFIIVTGYQEVEDKCSDIPHTFMRKPFNPEVLEAVLAELDLR
ncbi:response regulator [Mariprofundus erugo]|uniref:response regulator n=1 Tax=Mariprofundus erugo TaxID=2528639 RepID=UPI0010FE6EDD|nr:response regulator [Mariprofundus erugo]TLS74806.1 response regulator [Mariprofundus erugo]